jgi:hypothetical protein
VTEAPTNAELLELVRAAAAARQVAREAREHQGGHQTASRPQRFRCDDGQTYSVKFMQNQHGDGRAIFTEQVIGLLGALLGALVAPVELVRVPDELAAALVRDRATHGLDFDPGGGVHHGSRWAAGHSERAALDHLDANRARFGALDVLYAWAVCAGDQQFIYANTPPYPVLSVDHTTFLPGGPAWSEATLASHGLQVARDPVLQRVSLDANDRSPALTRLAAATAEEIAGVVARPPNDWGVGESDRVALARFLLEREDAVIATLS